MNRDVFGMESSPCVKQPTISSRTSSNGAFPQFLTIYAGTSWAVVEFADFMVEEFLLSPHWTRVAPGSILLVPSVLMLAWSRGKAGPVYSICASG